MPRFRKLHTGQILSNREVAKDHYRMSIAMPAAFREAAPGQFVLVRVKDRAFPFLGRPLGVYAQEKRGGENQIELLYRVAGRGTAVFALLKKGDFVEILGPLGRGFSLVRGRDRIVLIAGGIGIAPLAPLARMLRKKLPSAVTLDLYYGARRADLLTGLGTLRKSCGTVRLATDDGSRGFRGPVTELFDGELKNYPPERTVIYACGPHTMLKRVSEILGCHPIPCQVSVEERMACGVGACLGCAVETKDGGKPYRRVCMEGPVFDINEIVWR
ncbi:MAG TPA: dihydroorotate dehydrogenase electron transfer subunit [Syntrophales bacterium]|nr:dihydroorotate dehydrogenase electron transfer subunit [Syntrophales bacterium]HOX95096.1 dihydroorotate dehydrogenase electron transfer subunit [Syntrophales bacterium]HPI57849.1 dihydroorotate dehydrogenase electron transfer subunit [Syntrophales bacterium]HPN24507.1 dihydroorotate dehydrogenase electron transfer subunit [Syntrophales bacterium]HQM28813.1 dihydroorotate dehydrogenase electron transfer subunit [Syntrophales bacterium]